MDKAERKWERAKSITALLLTAVLLCFAAGNLVAQQPWFRFAADEGWDFVSRLSAANDVANGHVLGQEWFLDAYAGLERLQGRHSSGDFEVVRGKGGVLDYTSFFPYETNDFDYYGQRMLTLSRLAEENGGHFMFLNTTDLRHDDYGDLPAANLASRNNAMIYTLQGYGVPYLDARTVANGMDARYQTSAMWTTESSFKVFGAVMQQVYSTFGLSLDTGRFYTSSDSYMRITYPDYFAGELGRQAGIPFAGLEDFALYLPAFSTDFSMLVAHHNQEATVRGSFEDVLVAGGSLTDANPYLRGIESIYLGGQAPRRVITNHNCPTGAKVLIIGDGYALPLASFMAPAVKELHLLWPYENPRVDDLASYIRDNKFDLVLMMLSPNNMTAAGMGILG